MKPFESLLKIAEKAPVEIPEETIEEILRTFFEETTGDTLEEIP